MTQGPDPSRTPASPPEDGPGSGPPSSKPPWALLGRKLGRYRLGPSLGRGGMGEVFEAWDTLLNRAVAVKTLHAPQPDSLIRFMKEAQLQARISHPNVCRIYDVDVSESVPFIAMQLIKGPDLFLAAPQLTLEEAVEILATVALAMHAAHRVNLIHRDLKPSNILLERLPGGGWMPYVADFGLAKDLEEEGPTRTQGVLGTPNYMAPEQRRGESALIGPPTDVYALGATLCAVLELDPRGFSTGRTGPNGNEATGRSRSSWGRLPRKLKTILRRCLEERPQDRYPTAGALAEDFRRFLDGEPLLGGQWSWLRRVRRLGRRHPAWVASLFITLLLGAGFGLWSARLAAAGKRRSALALRFALDARDLENSIGVERLHPPHDLWPAITHMTEGLDRIQKDIAHLGPEAEGPGNLALGRGYLSMRRLEPALRALEEAWYSGYRTPEAAYALCKTHCEFYIRFLHQQEMGEAALVEEGASHHLQAARDYYALSAGSTWEPRELCGARLLNFEGRGAEALALARTLFAGNRWYYLAKVEEAYAFDTLGVQALQAQEPGRAKALFLQAEAAALAAQNIGRSDVVCYLAAADWRFHWLENPRIPPREALRLWTEAEAQVDVALSIWPGSPRGISAKVHAILGRARALKRLGGRPGPELARADRFVSGVDPAPASPGLLGVKREQIRKAREELGRLS